MNKEEELYNLNLHDKIYLNLIDAWIIRVPNGWIYQFVTNGSVTSSVFVEYSSEYYPG